MSQVFDLRTLSGIVLDFHDRSKVASWKLRGVGVNRDLDTSSRGCGFAAAGASAVLNKYHFNFWTRTYEIRLTGSTWGAAETLAYTLKDALDNAIKFQLGETGGAKLFLVRNLGDYVQATARVWTVLYGMWTPMLEEEYGIDPTGGTGTIPRYPVSLELALMDGTTTVDGSGYPTA